MSSYARSSLVALVIAAMPVLVTCASASRPAPLPTPAGPPPAPKYGRLQVIGTNLCGADGKPVQLRGMSTMGLQWYGDVVNAAAFTALAKDWKADVVRLALYVGEGGYASHSDLKQLVW